MNVIATHYGDHDISWIPELAGNNYFIYDRSGNVELPNKVSRENRGDADYDRLSYIADNYYDLPDVFLLCKSNIFKFITPEEFDMVKNNQDFTPILTKNHKTYEPICRYNGDIYEEINNSWYMAELESKYFITKGARDSVIRDVLIFIFYILEIIWLRLAAECRIRFAYYEFIHMIFQGIIVNVPQVILTIECAYVYDHKLWYVLSIMCASPGLWQYGNIFASSS